MEMINKVKCHIGYHDWFTETDKDNWPVFRICQCCGKYQQPLISDLRFTWEVIHPETITAKVLKEKMKLQTLITKPL